MKYQRGLSLSEVLISLFLTSLIISALTQFYLSNKRQYIEAQQILDKNFDLQWVGDLLSDSFRRVGFTPCLSVNQLTTKDMRDFSDHLSGFKSTNSPRQLVQINRMSEHFSKVLAISGATRILISRQVTLNPQHPVIIADCRHAEVHQILQIDTLDQKTLVTLNRPLFYSYESETYIGEWLEEQWFIKQNKTGANALYYSLYHTEEITPLVHSMHVEYDKHLIKVRMGLDQGVIKQLMVAVREL